MSTSVVRDIDIQKNYAMTYDRIHLNQEAYVGCLKGCKLCSQCQKSTKVGRIGAEIRTKMSRSGSSVKVRLLLYVRVTCFAAVLIGPVKRVSDVSVRCKRSSCYHQTDKTRPKVFMSRMKAARQPTAS
jgi:hypothetical protein